MKLKSHCRRAHVPASCLCLLLIAITTAPFAGCSERPAPARAASPKAYPYTITTTVGMVTDIVRQVAADKAQVQGIIGEGVDPHLYRTTRNDVAALMSADVVFYNGLLLEGKMADALVSIATKVRHVYQVTRLIDEQYLLEPAEFAGHFDPHVWMDVVAWMRAVEAVTGKLAEFDPANAAFYRKNATAYLLELEKLDRYARDRIATIPEPRRVLITAHDAFNYFGRAYQIEVLGIQGLSTESEAGLEQINRLVDLIVERNIMAVFVETSVSPKNIKALIEGAASRGQTIKIGGALFSDAMGQPGTYEGTYLGMIDHNVTTIARALGGKAPAGGMQGKLSGTIGHE